jgi:hypothetical protein
MSVVDIAAGTFTMGHVGDMQGAYGSKWFVQETPSHAVTLRAFRADRTEVTVEQFAHFLDWAGPWYYAPLQPIDVDPTGANYHARVGSEHEPMRHVTWPLDGWSASDRGRVGAPRARDWPDADLSVGDGQPDVSTCSILERSGALCGPSSRCGNSYAGRYSRWRPRSFRQRCRMDGRLLRQLCR